MTTPVTVDPALFTPTVAQVQSVLVAREAFTATSTPTDTQVAQRAADVASELAGELTVIPDGLIGLATSTVIYKVAADIEAGTWPEQQMGAVSSGGIWYARYVQSHDRLIALAAEYGDTPGTAKSIFAPSGTALAAAEWFKEGVNWPWPDCWPAGF